MSATNGKTREIVEESAVQAPSLTKADTLATIPIATRAEATDEYVVAGPLILGATNSALRVMPWNFDDLTTDFGPTIYERMSWDPIIKAVHDVIKKSVLAQGLKVIPAQLDKDDKRGDKAIAIAQRIRRNLDARVLNPDFDSVMLNMLDAMAYGNKIAELVWGYQEKGKDKGTTILKAIKVKSRRTVAFVVDRYLNVVGVLALNPGTGQAFPIGTLLGVLQGDANLLHLEEEHVLPREKFAILTHEPVDSDPRGTSYFRAAYSPWWGKMQLYPEYLRYLAQFGTPSLIGYTAPGASTARDAEGKTVSAQQAMQGALIGLRNSSVVTFPAGSKVEALMAHVAPKSFVDDFAHFNREMAIAIIHQEGTTGGATRESIGQSQAHQDVLGTIVRYAKRYACNMIERDIFTPMVAYNEGDDALDLVPSASYGETNEVDLAKLFAAMGQLGFELSPSQFAEIDQTLGLPARSPEELDVLTELATRIPPLVDPTMPSPAQTRLNPQNPAPQTVSTQTGGVVKGGSPPGKTNQNKNAASKTDK